MAARGLRRWSTALLMLVLPLLAGWLGAPSAGAANHDGACTDDTGVTVVVDHQDLGGGVVVRCATDFPSGGTGLDALRLAGFTPAGTVKDGSGFVCRINNRPSADEVLVVGGQDYREQCINTSPAAAFWSYWHSRAGGEWTFSNLGANRTVEAGGYEGWSFSLNRTSSGNPPPGVQPASRPEPTTPEPVRTTTAPVRTTPAPASTTAVAEPAPSGTTQAGTTRPPARPTSAGPTATATPSRTPPPPAPTPSVTPPTPTPTQSTSSAPPSPTPSVSSPVEVFVSGSATAAVETVGPATAEPVPAEPPPGEGPGVGTFLGAAAVAVFAGAGGVVWWRRRGVV